MQAWTQERNAGHRIVRRSVYPTNNKGRETSFAFRSRCHLWCTVTGYSVNLHFPDNDVTLASDNCVSVRRYVLPRLRFMTVRSEGSRNYVQGRDDVLHQCRNYYTPRTSLRLSSISLTLSEERERERERERICAYDWGGFGFWLLGDDATPLTYRFHVLRAISSVIQAQWYTIIGILYPAYTFPYVKCPMWNVSLLWMLNEDRYWVQQMASSGQNSSSDNDLPSLPYLNPQLSLSVEHTRGRAKPFRNSLYFHKYLQPLQGILGTSDPLCHLMKFFCKIKRQ